MQIDLEHLLQYTEWERQRWHEWLPARAPEALALSAGPHGDGRFTSIGDLIRHIFTAEQRYVDRLLDQSLTPNTVVPNDDIEAMFEFGRKSRRSLEELTRTLPDEAWDAEREMQILEYRVAVTPRKVVTHVLLHEIRHWAQIATLLRLNGLVDEFHDLIATPVMGGRWEREAPR